MAKDPAFLLYSSDFLTGTMFMSDEQVGKYIRLLCAQHQHGGLIEKCNFNAIALQDHMLRTKFVETEEGFYNERLMEEMQKRETKSCNLSVNARKGWEKRKKHLHSKCNANASVLHMPIDYVNDNENEDENINNLERNFQFLNDPKFKELWDAFLDMRKARKAKPTDRAKELLLKDLHKQSLEIACEMLKQSTINNWKGVFPPKGGNDGNGKRKSVVSEYFAERRAVDGRGDGRGLENNRGALPAPESNERAG